MDKEALARLLDDVRAGRLDVEGATARLAALPYEDLGFAKIDHHRALRAGGPEAVFCPGKSADQVVAVAGMEGALPSVIGGLVDRPVIAVPTSVGYGTSLNGLAALLAMLNSCAPGVSVVNIDNGYGAAHQARQINRLVAKIR